MHQAGAPPQTQGERLTYYAINGSPRKTHNTATIMNKALEGVKAADPQAQTELIHLYSHDFSGCVSCFECKRLGGKSYGKCVVRDGLTPILERLADADGIIFGSPVYFHSITGKMRMFFERLLFQYFVYDARLFRAVPETDAHGVRLHHERALPSHAPRATTRRASRAWSLSFRGCSPSPKPSM